MEEAERLLATGARTLAEVAALVGFSSATALRKARHCLPAAPAMERSASVAPLSSAASICLTTLRAQA